MILDLESYSEADLSVCGGYAYTAHPSTRVLCAAWMRSSGTVRTWAPGQPPPLEFAGATVQTWGRFDRLMYAAHLVPQGWPRIERWEDLMVRAAYGNLPLKLEKCANALRVEQRKDMEGHALMMFLSRPAPAKKKRAVAGQSVWLEQTGAAWVNEKTQHHRPEALARLAEYCAQDVRATAAVAALLPPLPPAVAALEILDRRIDARGLAVDLDLVNACQAAWETLAELLRERLVSITDGAVQRETKTKDMAAWLRVQGLTVSEGKGGFDAAAVQGLLAEAERRGLTAAAQVLRLRLALGKTSLAKFQTLQQATGGDGRLRGSLQFYGAHGTGRWAGRLVQTQNMPKGVLGRSPAKGPTYDMARKVIREHGTTALPAALYGTGEDPTPNCPGVPAVLGSLLRTCFVAAPGKTLYVADWSAIEGRGVIWLADDQTGLRAFADKKTDVYCVTASAIFGRPITKEDMERNKYGKPTFLGAGYGLGAARAEVQFGFDRATAEKAIAAYRATFPGVPALWRGLERAALTACAEPGRTVASAKGRVHWYHDGRHLHCRLPSGRELFYREALVGRSEKYDTPCLSYCYENFTTKQWERGQIWGGVLTENIVQALCCDLLGESLIRLDRDGWHPVLTVHDEILCEEDQGDPRFTVEKLCAAMCVLPAWAKGFPIAAEGYAAPYWRK